MLIGRDLSLSGTEVLCRVLRQVSSAADGNLIAALSPMSDQSKSIVDCDQERTRLADHARRFRVHSASRASRSALSRWKLARNASSAFWRSMRAASASRRRCSCNAARSSVVRGRFSFCSYVMPINAWGSRKFPSRPARRANHDFRFAERVKPCQQKYSALQNLQISGMTQIGRAHV